MIYVTTAGAAANHLRPKLLLATLAARVSGDFPLNTGTEEKKINKKGGSAVKGQEDNN